MRAAFGTLGFLLINLQNLPMQHGAGFNFPTHCYLTVFGDQLPVTSEVTDRRTLVNDSNILYN